MHEIWGIYHHLSDCMNLWIWETMSLRLSLYEENSSIFSFCFMMIKNFRFITTPCRMFEHYIVSESTMHHLQSCSTRKIFVIICTWNIICICRKKNSRPTLLEFNLNTHLVRVFNTPSTTPTKRVVTVDPDLAPFTGLLYLACMHTNITLYILVWLLAYLYQSLH